MFFEAIHILMESDRTLQNNRARFDKISSSVLLIYICGDNPRQIMGRLGETA